MNIGDVIGCDKWNNIFCEYIYQRPVKVLYSSICSIRGTHVTVSTTVQFILKFYK